MFKLGLAVFASYFLLLCIDELWFHRKRILTKKEKWSHRVDLILLLSCVATVLFFEYSDKTRIVFGILALLSILSITKDEVSHASSCSGSELWIHSLIFLSHPLMLITLGAIWPVIDGVSFFLNVVIPFTTHHLRPLCYGYLLSLTGLLIFQITNRGSIADVIETPQTDGVTEAPESVTKDQPTTGAA